jgi:large subunit ribosomal protein L22
MKAKLKNAPITPRKAHVIAYMIRGKKTQEALDMLEFLPKKGAKIFRNILQSALTNARVNDKKTEDNFIIERVDVGAGIRLRRHKAWSRGRAQAITKRYSHLQIILS